MSGSGSTTTKPDLTQEKAQRSSGVSCEDPHFDS